MDDFRKPHPRPTAQPFLTLKRPAAPAQTPAPKRPDHEHGLVGMFGERLKSQYVRLKTILFGRQAARSGWLRSRLPRPTTRRAQLIGAAIVVLAIGALAYGLNGRPKADQNVEATATPSVIPAPAPDQLPKGTPDYKTVTPDGKSVADLGGWTRVSPPDRDPVYAFTDKVGQIPVTVSQQPLPDGFKGGDTNQQIADLAKSFKASKKLDVNNMPAYLGASAKGPQSVIASKNDLLILAKSSAPLNDQQWIDYLTSLR